MRKHIIFELLKYLDCFGTKFHFYSERKRKFYTPLGGIFTLLSFIISILVFIFINKDEFMHNKPISTTSTSKIPNTKIKFLKEKIWIPWRIRDYNSKTVNITNLLYPIIFYYRGIYNETKKSLDLSYKIINYRLCNESSMANYTDSYTLDIALDKVYCIDMDDLDMGGNFESDFVFYLQFDLYACKNGISYDKNNPNCSSYEKIIEAAGEDNSFELDLYYPVVHYQPLVKENPLFVKYSNYFFHLSRFTNKIDRLFLQKYQLTDDIGWILKNEKTINHWGVVSLAGDSYATGDKKDLMNEGSTSRLYSFNIYVNSDIVNYNRNYKNIFLIISDGFPTVNIIFIIFRLIAKIFKISASNQKLTELLFENLQEKSNKFKSIRPNTLILTKDKTIKTKNSNSQMKISHININNYSNSKIFETSSLPLYSGYDLGQRLFKNINIKKKNSLPNSEKSRVKSFIHNNIKRYKISQENIVQFRDNHYINHNSANNYNKNYNNKINNIKFDKIKKIWNLKKNSL